MINIDPKFEAYGKKDELSLKLEGFKRDKAEIELNIQKLKLECVGLEDTPRYINTLKGFEDMLKITTENIQEVERELEELQ